MNSEIDYLLLDPRRRRRHCRGCSKRERRPNFDLCYTCYWVGIPTAQYDKESAVRTLQEYGLALGRRVPSDAAQRAATELLHQVAQEVLHTASGTRR